LVSGHAWYQQTFVGAGYIQLGTGIGRGGANANVLSLGEIRQYKDQQTKT